MEFYTYDLWGVLFKKIFKFSLSDDTITNLNSVIDIKLSCYFDHSTIDIRMQQQSEIVHHEVGYCIQQFENESQRLYFREMRSHLYKEFNHAIKEFNQDFSTSIQGQATPLSVLLQFINEEYYLPEFYVNDSENICIPNKLQKQFTSCRENFQLTYNLANKKLNNNCKDLQYSKSQKNALIIHYQKIQSQQIFFNSKIEYHMHQVQQLQDKINNHGTNFSFNFTNQFKNKVFIKRTEKFEQWKARKIVEDQDFLINIFVIKSSITQQIIILLEQYHKINTPFVQKLYNYWFEPSYKGYLNLFLQLEYVDHPTIVSLMDKNLLQNCNDDDLWQVTSQLFIAIHIIEQQNIFHNNIDTTSIHLNNSLQIKICDLIPNIVQPQNYSKVQISVFLEQLWQFNNNSEIQLLFYNIQNSITIEEVMEKNPLQQKLQQQGQFYTLVQKLASKTNQQKIYSTLIEVLKKKSKLKSIKLDYNQHINKIVSIIISNHNPNVLSHQNLVEITHLTQKFIQYNIPIVLFKNKQHFNIINYPIISFIQNKLTNISKSISTDYMFYCFLEQNFYQKLQQIKKISLKIQVEHKENIYSVYYQDIFIAQFLMIENYIQLQIIKLDDEN